MEGQASISPDILADYAADAARGVNGVAALSERPLPGRRAVRIAQEDGRVRVELHVVVAWGASIPEVGREVQRTVREYLARMAHVDSALVDVVVDELGAPA